MSFIKAWLDAVDSILLDRASLIHDDLDNYDFEFAYRCGFSPMYAAIEALFDINLEDIHQ